MRGWFALVLIGAVWLACGGTARAASVCDGFGEQLNQPELTRIANTLQRQMQAQYARRLAAVKIVNGDEAGTTGLVTIESLRRGEPTVIAIPRGFKRFVCKLLQTGAGISGGYGDSAQSVSFVVNECVRTTAKPVECFNASVMRISSGLDALYADKPASAEYVAQVREWTDAALLFMIAHEGGHVIFSGKDRGELIPADVDTETAADVLAATTVLNNNEVLFPGRLAFATWAVLDKHLDWSRSPHESYGCRASVLTRIERDMDARLDLIRSWATDRSDFLKTRKDVDAKPEPIPAFASVGTCPSVKAPFLDQLRNDLDGLLIALDRASAKPAGDLAGVLGTIKEPKPKTDAVRSFQALLLTGYASIEVTRMVASLQADDGDDSDSAKEASMLALRNQIAVALKLVSDAVDPKLLQAEWYATVFFQFDMFRRGLGLRTEPADWERTMAYFGEYAPGSPMLSYIEALKAFSRGECARGKALMDGFFSAAADPDASQEAKVMLRSFRAMFDQLSDGDCKANMAGAT